MRPGPALIPEGVMSISISANRNVSLAKSHSSARKNSGSPVQAGTRQVEAQRKILSDAREPAHGASVGSSEVAPSQKSSAF